MQLSELFGKAGLECPREAEKIEVKNIVTDSRRVEKGSLFICLRGTRADGHEYMDEAIRSGASVIVAEKVRDACVGGAAAIILLDNTRSVSARLYNAWYGNPTERLKIVGATGTNGKTSVSTMLYEVFTALGYKAGLIGTVKCLSVGGKVLKIASKDPLANMTTPDPEELSCALSQLERDGVEYVLWRCPLMRSPCIRWTQYSLSLVYLPISAVIISIFTEQWKNILKQNKGFLPLADVD